MQVIAPSLFVRFLPVLLLALTLLFFSPEAYALPSSDVALTREAFAAASKGRWDQAEAVAKRSRNPAVLGLVRWYYARGKSSNANFEDIQNFLAQYPDWPDRNTLILRGEQALMGSHPTSVIRQWFEQFPPKTGNGMLLYAEALFEGRDISREASDPDVARGISLLRDAWRRGKVDGKEQDRFLATYGKLLRREDNIEAISNLLWDGKTDQAAGLLSMVDDAYRRLFTARIKFLRNQSGLEQAVREIPRQLQNDPGVLFDRISWRHERGMKGGVVELFESAPDILPYPEKWWEIKRLYIWELIESGDYQAAYRLSKEHSQSDGKEFAEGEWWAGWLAYAYLKDPALAYKHFYNLYHGVQFPVSKSRGAYWAGRAALQNGNQDIGKRWISLATEYPSTFYGQLAISEMGSLSPTQLPGPERISKDTLSRFLSKPVPQAALLLDAIGEDGLAKLFVAHLMESAKSDTDRVMASGIATQSGDRLLGVRTAKEAVKYNTVLADTGYPVIKFVSGGDVEDALVMAIARQESEFKVDAKSSAGAVGLVQVMPATGKYVAKKHGLSFNEGRLRNDPAYNLQIGSAYLSGLVNQFDGSYVLAIASYNAGPGRVRRWMDEFGDPRDRDMDPVLWVERIPITETRNYVQRVLENLQMYRHKMSGFKGGKVQLAEDLNRGS